MCAVVGDVYFIRVISYQSVSGKKYNNFKYKYYLEL